MGPRAPGTNNPLRRRDKRALVERDRLIEQYMAEGLSREEAIDRAQAEMRNNPKGDWHRG